MVVGDIDLTEDVPGVLPVNQRRSVILRDNYIRSGIYLLNKQRLSEIKVSDLACEIGASVGSFYTRFEDKDAFFRALRAATIAACNREIRARIGMDRLYEMDPAQSLDEMVDLLADLFNGDYRGVLRESLLRILEPDDPWAPMRDSAREIMRNYRRAMATEFPAFDEEETRFRLSFCFQIVVGALQNDLVNDYHVLTMRDDSLRRELKKILYAYMRLDV